MKDDPTARAVAHLAYVVEEQTRTMKAIAVHLSLVIADAGTNNYPDPGPTVDGFTLDELNKTIDDIKKCEREEHE